MLRNVRQSIQTKHSKVTRRPGLQGKSRKYVQEEGCEIAAPASQLRATNCRVDRRIPIQKTHTAYGFFMG